jgi:hypothetical protein
VKGIVSPYFWSKTLYFTSASLMGVSYICHNLVLLSTPSTGQSPLFIDVIGSITFYGGKSFHKVADCLDP